MTNTNDLPLGRIERIAFEAAKAAREGDHQTHAALHVVEIKLGELRMCCLEAEKVVKGDERLMLLALIRASLATPGTPESAALIDRLVSSEETHSRSGA